MKVAIVGGGVIGLSIAWRCAARGADVTVIDPAPGQGASWVAGGMLAPVAEAHRGEEAITAVGVESARRWPGFVADLVEITGTDCGYTTQGTLIAARDGDDLGELADLFALHHAAGLPAERVSSRDARRLEPALSTSVRAALWLPDDHQVDNRLLLHALADACARTDVSFAQATAVSIDARSVTIESGAAIEADSVVVATGAWTPPVVIEGELVTLAVRPVKGQIVRVRATPSAVFPTRTVRGLDVYVIPRSHGEIAIGATSEEKGFDTTVTAGAVLDLLRYAWELVPGLAEAEFLEVIAGLRPGTPDNAPLIGRWGSDGPVIATGHFRHGVLLAPVTADAVTAMVFADPTATTALAPLIEPLDPRRFEAVAA